ncbi:hypothetical protein QBC35DRAFT_254828 [Podospora australis]|uniref:Protein kinase domain-containing protein n=1 Tax=Podospora australis TaxID=1536484 RepID=A0AAN7AFM0_9PEZI|nr:hypothetical protein QBC35DRAFT_254828 [Podospora australis]
MNRETSPTRTIRGNGVPLYHNHISGGEPSVITDLGHSRYHAPQKRTDSDPMSHDSGLRNGLMHAMLKPDPWQEGFIPKSQLYKLISKEDVREELRDCDILFLRRLQKLKFSRFKTTKELNEDADRICGNGEQKISVYFKSEEDSPLSPQFRVPQTFRKIFAILLLIERPAKIWKFMEDNVSDADLPLVKFTPPSKQGNTKRWELCRRKTPETPLTLFKNWRRITMERFEKQQWAVLSPYFSRDTSRGPGSVPHYLLPDSTIMPFLQVEEKHRSKFSQVFMVEIHEDHHDFSSDHGLTDSSMNKNPSRNIFAVKRLLSKDNSDLKKEVDVLRRVNRQGHAHIITLLAIYTYHGKYHLIFPWAGSDLMTYWKNQDPSSENDPVVVSRWLVKQCQGLASGLATIHRCQTTSTDSLLGGPRRSSHLPQPHRPPIPPNSTSPFPSPHDPRPPRLLYCRHGDIKPQNILWFPPTSPNSPSRGTFKITDFGTAELSVQDAVPWRTRLAFTPMYEPPETHLPITDDVTEPVLRTSYDIWSLGCVFLEFITWYFGGWQKIEEFADMRFADQADDEAHFLGVYDVARFFSLRQGNGGRNRAEVKRSVTQFIKELHSADGCTEFIHEFLVIIEEEMLVVEEAGTATTRRRVRSCSRAIAARLEKMGDEQYRRYTGYFTQGAAWRW